VLTGLAVVTLIMKTALEQAERRRVERLKLEHKDSVS